MQISLHLRDSSCVAYVRVDVGLCICMHFYMSIFIFSYECSCMQAVRKGRIETILELKLQRYSQYHHWGMLYSIDSC